jgi:hypothetical protein
MWQRQVMGSRFIENIEDYLVVTSTYALHQWHSTTVEKQSFRLLAVTAWDPTDSPQERADPFVVPSSTIVWR